MILKPGKNPTDVTSYRPISLLPVISKILEKLLLLRLSNEMPPQTWIPSHQFGFRKKHSTIHQCHRLTDTILKAFEDQKYCSAVFLYISQAFDKVWHTGLLLKIQQTLPPQIFHIPAFFFTTPLPCSFLQQCQLIPSPDALGGSSGEHPGTFSIHTIHGGHPANLQNHSQHVRRRHGNYDNPLKPNHCVDEHPSPSTQN